MRREISHTERNALDYIGRYMDRHRGLSPTVREIGNGIGMSSTSAVTNVLGRLERRGLLTRIPHQPRSLRLTQPRTARPQPAGPTIESVRVSTRSASELPYEVEVRVQFARPGEAEQVRVFTAQAFLRNAARQRAADELLDWLEHEAGQS